MLSTVRMFGSDVIAFAHEIAAGFHRADFGVHEIIHQSHVRRGQVGILQEFHGKWA